MIIRKYGWSEKWGALYDRYFFHVGWEIIANNNIKLYINKKYTCIIYNHTYLLGA